jgi:hypothetical protein
MLQCRGTVFCGESAPTFQDSESMTQGSEFLPASGDMACERPFPSEFGGVTHAARHVRADGAVQD